MRHTYIRFLAKALLLTAMCLSFVSTTAASEIQSTIAEYCPACVEKLSSSTGTYILEEGEDALLTRAWLTNHASETIDVQYFIWSTDNIGVLAGESLLSAAERGVQVRVLVDDLLIDADSTTLIALDAHPNVQIKVYNPKHKVGTSTFKRAWNLITDFRDSNQRMHDKTAIFDQVAGITGGRNMADEYFDFNSEYNFRDRDILLMGKAVKDMSLNFEEFWSSELSVPVQALLKGRSFSIDDETIANHYKELHEYAANDSNYESNFRQSLQFLDEYFPTLTDDLIWDEVSFISDVPGKNDSGTLGGGGETTDQLFELLKSAESHVRIQSPYLIVPKEALQAMSELVEQGVTVEISTNSLVSTDNMLAFSGYRKQRKALLEAGVKIYEFKDHPQIQTELISRYPNLKENNPIFAIHAKSMVVDKQHIYIGTFNLDPRSTNLNTEVGVLMENSDLGQQLHDSIGRDISAENSWAITESFNPDKEASLRKRTKLRFLRLLPIKKVL